MYVSYESKSELTFKLVSWFVSIWTIVTSIAWFFCSSYRLKSFVICPTHMIWIKSVKTSVMITNKKRSIDTAFLTWVIVNPTFYICLTYHLLTSLEQKPFSSMWLFNVSITINYRYLNDFINLLPTYYERRFIPNWSAISCLILNWQEW